MNTILIATVVAVVIIALMLIVIMRIKNDNANSENNLKQDLRLAQERCFVQEEQLNDSRLRIEEQNAKLEVYVDQLTDVRAKKIALEVRLAEQKNEFEQMKKIMKEEFENMTTRLFSQTKSNFSEANKESLDKLLKPLGDSIVEFKKTVGDNLVEETKQRSQLKEQVAELVKKTEIVSNEANNLASALKGKSKIRGNWGEMILERVLESAGLREGEGYNLQNSVRNAEGQLLIPDVVIHLPGGRNVVVDSKVSLIAYERYFSADTEDQAAMALAQHISDMRLHIKSLSDKEYQNHLAGSNLDYVMMFVPIEPAYLLALQGDGELWNYAYARGVMLVSPSNLLPCVRLINDMWDKEKQSQNAIDIVARATRIYDKMAGFVDNLKGVDVALIKARDAYDKAYGQLSTGSGNVLRQFDQMKQLGVKTSKNLPEGSAE